MKKFLRFFAIIAVLALAVYAAFLVYDRLIKKSETDQWDDLEDWGYEFEDEKQPEITFTERIRAAADKHLRKAR
ncbi:MAG: hypothetical protein E7233_02615 [Lachnospiraceae bacterium]|nr:hypothetical protein [Lachnospiraceae bacterium]